MIVKGNSAKRICLDRPGRGEKNSRQDKAICMHWGNVRATTLCRETDFAYSTLMEVSLLDGDFLNERITMRSLNQFCQRDRTLRVSDIRIDRLPSTSWIRAKHCENFHVASSWCTFSVTSNNFWIIYPRVSRDKIRYCFLSKIDSFFLRLSIQKFADMLRCDSHISIFQMNLNDQFITYHIHRTHAQ